MSGGGFSVRVDVGGWGGGVGVDHDRCCGVVGSGQICSPGARIRGLTMLSCWHNSNAVAAAPEHAVRSAAAPHTLPSQPTAVVTHGLS